ncbi:GNAT family N-acetyltransferase [Candidatus Micrarchaeota archaeon]|nr:GNAT family N-acetyltransferase [Candidatus Micrarchaeota archaeon]
MIQVREFTEQDAQSVGSLVKKAVEGLPKETYGQYLSEYYSRNSPKALLDFLQHGAIFVAVEGQSVVGTARLDFIKQKIYGMFVDPSFQGRGVGALLLDAVEKLAAKKGFKQVVLSSTIPAARFYEKRGFKRIDENPANKAFDRIVVSGPVVDMKKGLFSTKN